MPEIQINLTAVIVAVVANFIFGFVWFTFLFRNAWAREMGFDVNEQPERSAMIKGMILNLIGNFLLAWVLAHNIAVWDPQSWGLPPSDLSPIASAGMAAFFTWLGFYVPIFLGTVAWEKRSWKLFGINSSYHLLALLIVANIITFM